MVLSSFTGACAPPLPSLASAPLGWMDLIPVYQTSLTESLPVNDPNKPGIETHLDDLSARLVSVCASLGPRDGAKE